MVAGLALVFENVNLVSWQLQVNQKSVDSVVRLAELEVFGTMAPGLLSFRLCFLDYQVDNIQ